MEEIYLKFHFAQEFLNSGIVLFVSLHKNFMLEFHIDSFHGLKKIPHLASFFQIFVVSQYLEFRLLIIELFVSLPIDLLLCRSLYSGILVVFFSIEAATLVFLSHLCSLIGTMLFES